VPNPRLRSHPEFAALRSELLRELGVDEVVEGAHESPATPSLV
jgi:hypothetical protein